MKKINATHSGKDCIICVSLPGKHQFYYQEAGTKERSYLCEMPYSGSVFAYFRDKGRCMDGIGFSLTVNELYRFRDYRNVKLARVMESLPGRVDCLLKHPDHYNEDTSCFDMLTQITWAA